VPGKLSSRDLKFPPFEIVLPVNTSPLPPGPEAFAACSQSPMDSLDATRPTGAASPQGSFLRPEDLLTPEALISRIAAHSQSGTSKEHRHKRQRLDNQNGCPFRDDSQIRATALATESENTGSEVSPEIPEGESIPQADAEREAEPGFCDPRSVLCPITINSYDNSSRALEQVCFGMVSPFSPASLPFL